MAVETQADLAKEYAAQQSGESQEALAREYAQQQQAPAQTDTGWLHKESPVSYQWAQEHPVANTMLRSFDIGNVLKNAWEGGKGLATGAYDMGKDLVQNPNWFEGKDSTANKFLFKPSDEQAAKAKQSFQQGHYSEAAGHGLAAAVPFVGPWAANLGEQAGTGDVGGAAGSAAGTMLAGETAVKGAQKIGEAATTIPAVTRMVQYAKQTGDPFRTGLQVASHDMLNKASDVGKKTLRDTEAKVSARVGGLKDDIANSDIQESGGQPKIPIADLIPQISDLAQRYKASGAPLPKFDAIVAKIPERGPYLTFEEAAALRSDIGRNWAKATAPADAAAVNELYNSMTEKLANRAEELGHSKTFNDYNGLYRTLKDYQRGPLGQLLDSPDGQSFFNILRDPANGAAFRRVSDSLSDFGLDKNYLNNLGKTHATLHDFAKAGNSSLGFTGRFKALAQHPMLGAAGWMAGRMVGGWPGGMLGTIGGANLADAVNVSREIAKRGGPPSTTGEMKQFISQPSGEPVQRPTPPDPQTKADLISALQSQGFNKQTATAATIAAMKAHPSADFGTLFNEAIRNRSVSGGSQSADPWANLSYDKQAVDMAKAEKDAGTLPEGVSYVQRAQQIKEMLMKQGKR